MVDFLLKLLYSSHKNKKTPAYMLKSILISLEKIEFDRENEVYRQKAMDLVQVLKANCYQKMIELFKLESEIEFFHQLAIKKLEENKPRDVVMLS